MPGHFTAAQRRRTTLVVAAAAAVATPALAAHAAKPPKADAISLTASPAEVVFGGEVTFDGRVNGTKAGVAVDLQRDVYPYGDGFAPVATTTTSTSGAYSFKLKPARNAHYRAVAHTATSRTSAEVVVGVRSRVGIRVSNLTPPAGTRVRFSGSVWPAHDGRVLRIQRRTVTGTWSTVARTRLRDAGSRRSRYTRRVQIPGDGVYRALLRAHGDHLAGMSREVTIDAR